MVYLACDRSTFMTDSVTARLSDDLSCFDLQRRGDELGLSFWTSTGNLYDWKCRCYAGHGVFGRG